MFGYNVAVQMRQQTLTSVVKTAWRKPSLAETWRCRLSFSTVAPSTVSSVKSQKTKSSRYFGFWV